MKLHKWFKDALANKAYYRKSWMLSVFSLVSKESSTPKVPRPTAWDISYVYDENSETYMPIDIVFKDGDGVVVDIEDFSFDVNDPKPPLHIKDKIEIHPEEVLNLKSKTITYAGTLLANYLSLIYPYGDKVEYINKRFSLADVEKIIIPRVHSDPTDGSFEPDKIYVRDVIRSTRGAGMLSGLAVLCVPSATRKSLTTHPDMPKLKKKLFEENKDNLSDPVAVVAMEKQFIDLDNKHLEGDESEGFLIGKKSRNVIRKKTFGMVGYIDAFSDITDTKAGTVPFSFSEGLDIRYMPQMVSDSRSSSYDRGADTAFGGDEVKKAINATQNTKIIDGDCKTKETTPVMVTVDNKDSLMSCWIVVGGKLTLITVDNIGNYMGKVVNLRSPLHCRQDNNNICSVCIGETYAKYPNSLPSAMAKFGQIFQDIFMASMHAKELSTAEYDIDKHII